MTDMYSEKETSSKKYLVPLVVLLLCGVAMTGAAFAYSSTLDDGHGDVDPEFITISLGETLPSLTFTTTDKIEFDTAVKDVEGTATITYALSEDGNTATFLVYVFGEGTPSTDFEPVLTIGDNCTTNVTGLTVSAEAGDYTAVSGKSYIGTFEVTLTFETTDDFNETVKPTAVTVTLDTLTAEQEHTA